MVRLAVCFQRRRCVNDLFQAVQSEVYQQHYARFSKATYRVRQILSTYDTNLEMIQPSLVQEK
jgi:hypothetical protein